MKVVEMGVWVAGPSCACILSDWGADVVKLEPPTGDPFRGLFASALGAPGALNPPFEIDNRGKRSVAINLEDDRGRDIARKLIDSADVFVTNMRPRVLDNFGLDYATLSKANPKLVYCQITGYGADGYGEAALLAFSWGQRARPSRWLLSLGASARVAGTLGRSWLPYAFRAWQRGRRAANLLVLPWEELLDLPLADVRRALRIEPPELAHPSGMFVFDELPGAHTES